MNRLRQAAVLLWGAALFAGVVSGAAPDRAQFAGTWTLDAGKSQLADSRGIILTLDLKGNVLNFAAAVKRGSEATASKFSCDTSSGIDCIFDEAGHNSKISVYFNGPALNFCKTDGPVGDVVTEWKLELSPGGDTLKATVSHVDPAGQDEVLVFTRKAS